MVGLWVNCSLVLARACFVISAFPAICHPRRGYGWTLLVLSGGPRGWEVDSDTFVVGSGSE